MTPALFLDRDGVIVENRETYIRSWLDVAFLDGALPALAALAKLPHRIVIITNQSAVGRGLLEIHAAEEINRRIVDVVRQAGGRIDAVYMCPHHPRQNCRCRKPQPGLIEQAVRELQLDLADSYLIGDALTDVGAAHAAGVSAAILVRTGRGRRQESLPEAPTFRPFMVYNSLAAATSELLLPNLL